MMSSDRVSTRRGQLRFGRPIVERKPANAQRKCRPDLSPPAAFPPRPARLRTETSYEAGSARRVSQSSQSRSHSVVQVNDELVQGQLTFLSGEVCIDGMHVIVAPSIRACPKVRNVAAEAAAGGAEVSRGRSTVSQTPLSPGRTER